MCSQLSRPGHVSTVSNITNMLLHIAHHHLTGLTSCFYRVEDIHANLFSVKCNMQSRELKLATVNGQTAIPFSSKLLSGVAFVLLLLFVLISPVVLFSTLNPALEPNNVMRGDVLVSVRSSDFHSSFELFRTKQVEVLHTLNQVKQSFLDEDKVCASVYS